MTTVEADLERLGDSLELAATRDLARGRPGRTLPSRRTAAVVAAFCALLVGGGVGIAGALLKTPAQEEQGLLDAEAIFAGTSPRCARVSARHFHCVLSSAPTAEHVVGSYRGVTMASVDGDRRIDGGCVATADDGLVWECYLGDEAVERGLLDAAMLGRPQAEPGVG
jgi:hypothetical protein